MACTVDSDEVSLRDFLVSCRSGWGPRELLCVQRKLASIGVSQVPALLLLVADGSLNDRLEAAGERRFAAATLAAMKGKEKTAAVEKSSSGDRFELFDMDDIDVLRRQVCRGLDRIAEVASESHRRNKEVSLCLQEVQADIARISQRMSAARQQRQRDRTSIPAAAAPAQPEAKPMRPKAGSSLPPPGPRIPKAPGAAECRSCPRAAQSGFSFGGTKQGEENLRLPEAVFSASDPIRDCIRAELIAARHGSEADRRSMVKRLLVKWHPDRNPGSIELATSMFQYIQQEKSKLLGI